MNVEEFARSGGGSDGSWRDPSAQRRIPERQARHTAGIVTKDERSYCYFACDRIIDNLAGCEFRSARDAERAADQGTPKSAGIASAFGLQLALGDRRREIVPCALEQDTPTKLVFVHGPLGKPRSCAGKLACNIHNSQMRLLASHHRSSGSRRVRVGARAIVLAGHLLNSLARE